MAKKAKRAKTGYVVDAQVAFVPHPDSGRRGLWVKVHPAVLRAGCPYVCCQSAVGEPCKAVAPGRVTPLGRYTAGCHKSRIAAVKALPRDIPAFSVRFLA